MAAPDLKQQLYDLLSGAGRQGERCLGAWATLNRLVGAAVPCPASSALAGRSSCLTALEPAQCCSPPPPFLPPLLPPLFPSTAWSGPLACSAGPLTRISPGLRVAGSSALKLPLQAEQAAAIKQATGAESRGSGVWVLPAAQLEVGNSRGYWIGAWLVVNG